MPRSFTPLGSTSPASARVHSTPIIALGLAPRSVPATTHGVGVSKQSNTAAVVAAPRCAAVISGLVCVHVAAPNGRLRLVQHTPWQVTMRHAQPRACPQYAALRAAPAPCV